MVKQPIHPVLNSLGIPIRSNREWREIAEAAVAQANAVTAEVDSLRATVAHLTAELETARRHNG